jgi:hypothetical protein
MVKLFFLSKKKLFFAFFGLKGLSHEIDFDNVDEN